jgi:hypothetical protein
MLLHCTRVQAYYHKTLSFHQLNVTLFQFLREVDGSTMQCKKSALGMEKYGGKWNL